MPQPILAMIHKFILAHILAIIVVEISPRTNLPSRLFCGDIILGILCDDKIEFHHLCKVILLLKACHVLRNTNH